MQMLWTTNDTAFEKKAKAYHIFLQMYKGYKSYQLNDTPRQQL